MYKILLVDDEKIIVDSLRTFLAERFDMEYHSALSANEAMGILRRVRFDIVITDISMPGMNGLDLVDYIKKRWPDCRIIVLTGFEVFQYAYRAHQYPGVEFLLKIEEYDTVADRVGMIIDNLEKEHAREQFYADLEERIANMLPMIRWNMVERALRYGESLPDELERRQISMTLNPDAPCALVGGKICISCPHNDEVRTLDRWTLMITNQLAKRDMAVYPHVSDKMIFWIIQSSASDLLSEQIIFLREAISSLIENSNEQSLSLVIASEFIEWKEISHVYFDIKQALEHLYQPGMCMIQSPDRKRHETARHITTDCLNRLTELFFSGRQSEFKALLAEELAPLRTIKNLPSALPNPTVSAITLLVASILQVLALPDWPLHRFGKILQCRDYSEGEQWTDDVLNLADQLFSLTEYSRKYETTALIDSVDSFIQENYKHDISLSSIAAHVHYNPSYLSRLYKEKKGINITSSINNVRMEHACDMLKETMLSVQEISRLNGFFSPNYFSKVFRKKYGMSPADYRILPAVQPEKE